MFIIQNENHISKKKTFFSSSAKSNKTFPQDILNWINFSFHKIHTENREILSFLLLFSYLVQRKKLLTLKSLVFNEFLCRTSLSFYFFFSSGKIYSAFCHKFSRTTKAERNENQNQPQIST